MEQANMQLSIVVNMYNTASFLPRCMETLLDQDIPTDSYEIILVDDGSTDNSLVLAQEYAAKSTAYSAMPSVRVEHHANKGLAGARNTGLRAAKGKYLCFVDPDDYIEKQSLAALLNQMDEENLDVLRFNYQKVDELGNNIPDSPMERSFDYSSQIMTGVEFMKNRLTTSCYVWAYIYRRELIVENDINFDESCYFDDVPWLPRVLTLAQRVNCVSIRHLLYTQRTGSLVNNNDETAILNKLNMQLKLLDILCAQIDNVEQSLHNWYKNMITHIALSYLNLVAIYKYDKSFQYLKDIKKYNIFPLSKNKTTKQNCFKINIINLSLITYITLVHFINKK